MTRSSPQPGSDDPAILAAWRLRVGHLNPRQPHEVAIHPDAKQRAALARELGLLDLPALHLTGNLRAIGREDWQLDARLQARVVQPCVVSLAPVETVIDEELRRIWTPDLAEPDEAEAEMASDADLVEALGTFIDLGEVLHEALILALPLYPRAEDADVPEASPADEEDRQRPFADLSSLLASRKIKGAGKG